MYVHVCKCRGLVNDVYVNVSAMSTVCFVPPGAINTQRCLYGFLASTFDQESCSIAGEVTDLFSAFLQVITSMQFVVDDELTFNTAKTLFNLKYIMNELASNMRMRLC